MCFINGKKSIVFVVGVMLILIIRDFEHRYDRTITLNIMCVWRFPRACCVGVTLWIWPPIIGIVFVILLGLSLLRRCPSGLLADWCRLFPNWCVIVMVLVAF